MVLMPSWIDPKVVLASCSLLVASVAFLWNWRRSRKRLAYGVSSNPVVQTTVGLHGKIVIYYDSGGACDNRIQVRDVYAARLTIKNNGSQDIEKGDFDSRLIFSVPKQTKILSVAIGPCEPENLLNHIDFSLSSPQQLALSPMLLNAGETVSFSLVLAGVENSSELSENMVCDGRIKGISRITADFNPHPNVGGFEFFTIVPLCFFIPLYWDKIPFIQEHGKDLAPALISILFFLLFLLWKMRRRA
jgi:hypothetical protein